MNTNTLRNRSEIPDEYKWDIESMYSDVEDVNADLDYAISRSEELMALKGRILENGDKLLSSIELYLDGMRHLEKALEDVVVVGYGVQKKKLVTGATVEVKGDDIAKMNTTQALGALQSMSPGVQIMSNSGKPGDTFNVNIRGAGTNGSTTPLYVIDGVAGGDINSINPSDIERIDVLKDAASSAIYGARAANGVILITTKQGKAGKIQISYDGNIGWQNVYKMVKPLTAKEYMIAEDMMRFNQGLQPFDWSQYIDADLLAAYQSGENPGTNWLERLRNKNAITTNHAVNIAGGSDNSTFSIGAGFQDQDGTFGSPAPSNYRRFTFRVNSEHVVLRGKDKREVLKVGENIYYQHAQTKGIQIGNQYSNNISTALRANHSAGQ